MDTDTDLVHSLVPSSIPVAPVWDQLLDGDGSLALRASRRSSSPVCQRGAKETAHPLGLSMRPLGICKPLEELKATGTKEDGVPSANLARMVSGGFALLRRTKWLHHSDLEAPHCRASPRSSSWVLPPTEFPSFFSFPRPTARRWDFGVLHETTWPQPDYDHQPWKEEPCCFRAVPQGPWLTEAHPTTSRPTTLRPTKSCPTASRPTAMAIGPCPERALALCCLPFLLGNGSRLGTVLEENLWKKHRERNNAA